MYLGSPTYRVILKTRGRHIVYVIHIKLPKLEPPIFSCDENRLNKFDFNY